MIVLIQELFQNLLSKNGHDKITKDEWAFFLNWRATALRSAVAGGSCATGFVYFASRKLFRLNRINRFSLAAGSGIITGLWRIQESYKRCAEEILGLDGSRMQHEFKNLVLQRYGDNPHKMKMLSKYFYGEEVYSDSNPEYPRLIYRQRHVFMENPKVSNDEVYGGSDIDEPQQNHHQSSSDRNSLKLKGPSKEIKQVRINPGISTYGYGDPLEVLFGFALEEETEQPDASGDAAKVQGRNQKKLRRRQRIRQRHRESLSLGQPQLFS
ncbi:hypothetical protein RND81_14G033700 [Saponaria officinalis]|uniref:Uncharacterized protein n=1 Tax=Saponaria officinalis TaxID=3572 RepID=A0AAW1GS22_SAPOF